jgi:hypothetical protein
MIGEDNFEWFLEVLFKDTADRTSDSIFFVQCRKKYGGFKTLGWSLGEFLPIENILITANCSAIYVGHGCPL